MMMTQLKFIPILKGFLIITFLIHYEGFSPSAFIFTVIAVFTASR